MVICICRKICESDFDDRETLIQRVMQDDHKCGKCKKQFTEEECEGCQNPSPCCVIQ